MTYSRFTTQNSKMNQTDEATKHRCRKKQDYIYALYDVNMSHYKQLIESDE